MKANLFYSINRNFHFLLQLVEALFFIYSWINFLQFQYFNMIQNITLSKKRIAKIFGLVTHFQLSQQQKIYEGLVLT